MLVRKVSSITLGVTPSLLLLSEYRFQRLVMCMNEDARTYDVVTLIEG